MLKIPQAGPGPLSVYFSEEAEIRIEAGKRLIVALRPEALFRPLIVAEVTDKR